MTEPSVQETPFETPTTKAFLEMAFAILHELLGIYGFKADDDEEDSPERDYRINVNRNDDAVLALDIDANQPLRGILIGNRSSNVAAMERILINSLFQRLHLGKGQKLGRVVLLSVNGTRLDTRRENGRGDCSEDGKDRPTNKRPSVVVLVPEGVDVITRPARK